jgi:hypothetical protein
MPKFIACPYYRYDTKNVIHCEGISKTFVDPARKKRQIDFFCASVVGWERCEWAQKLNRKYEGETENEKVITEKVH